MILAFFRRSACKMMMPTRKTLKRRVRRRQMRMTRSTDVSPSSMKSTHGNLHPVWLVGEGTLWFRFALVDQRSHWAEERAMAKNLPSPISRNQVRRCVYFYRSNSRMNGCALVRPNLHKNRFMSAQTYFLTSLPSLSAPCLSQSSLDGFFVIFKSVVIETNTSSNCLYICHGLWALLRFFSIRFAQRRLTDRSPQQPVWGSHHLQQVWGSHPFAGVKVNQQIDCGHIWFDDPTVL